MNKVIITAPKSYLARTIDVLHDLKAVHILDHPKGRIDTGTPLEHAEEISGLLVSVRSLIATFGITGGTGSARTLKSTGAKNFRHLGRMVKRLSEETTERLDEIKEIEKKVSEIETSRDLVSTLQNIGLPLETYKDYASLSMFTGRVKNPGLLKTKISRKTAEFELCHSPEGLIALFVPTKFRETAAEILAGHGFAALDVSGIKNLKGYPSRAFEKLSSLHEKNLAAKRAAEKKLSRLEAKSRGFLLASESFLSTELEKAEAPLRFAASENVFVVSGWVTRKEIVGLTGAVQDATGGNAHISITHPSEYDNVPVQMSNSGPVKPFEFLMNLYALPKYNEIDPTVFMFLTFPLFFGIILGDVGYGVVVALLMFLVGKKVPSAKPLVGIIMPAAIASIIFGFIYGEIFGFESIPGSNGMMQDIPRLIDRQHHPETMLVISIIIGLVHVNAGLILGFFNELSHHGLRKAVLAKGSWWVIQAGAALALAASDILKPIFMIPSGFLIPGLVLATAGVVMLVFGEPLGVVEIPGLASNILSYSRLMAVGLASVGLAVVVNRFVTEIAGAGGFMIAVAILVGVLGHALNIALGIMGGFLQSLRLHYVEFFTKFYKGGAISFHPFGKTQKSE